MTPGSHLTEFHYRAALQTLGKAAQALRDLSPAAGVSPATLVAVAQTHALLALVAAHDPWLEADATEEVERDVCA